MLICDLSVFGGGSVSGVTWLVETGKREGLTAGCATDVGVITADCGRLLFFLGFLLLVSMMADLLDKVGRSPPSSANCSGMIWERLEMSCWLSATVILLISCADNKDELASRVIRGSPLRC